MRVLSLVSLIGLMLGASRVDAGCRGPEAHAPAAWARVLVRSADIIMDAEVVQQEDVTNARAAVLRPLTVYKGIPAETYVLALPASSGVIVTESYAGFDGRLRERRFVLLRKTRAGFETDPCAQYLVQNPAIRAAVIRNTGH